jgi:hypothetical protein
MCGMDGKSGDIRKERLQKLNEMFPDVFAENQLDWEKLKAAFGDDINFAMNATCSIGPVREIPSESSSSRPPPH